MKIAIINRNYYSMRFNLFTQRHGLRVRGDDGWATWWDVAYDPDSVVDVDSPLGTYIVMIRGKNDDGSMYTKDVRMTFDEMYDPYAVASILFRVTNGRFNVVDGIEDYSWRDIWLGTSDLPGILAWISWNVTGEPAAVS